METTEFARFVAEQQETDADAEMDRAQMRDEWLTELASLYRKIVAFLQDYISAGSISCDYAKIEVTEPEIGTYSADRMDIGIGRQHISLVPVGTFLIGCRGRVDVEGSAGRAQILLVKERAKSAADLIKVAVSIKGSAFPSPPAQQPISWAWKILTITVPKRFVDLDKESFFALLMEIANA